ncbi:hypothetical protein F4860DRAFT_499045 [Xylaria cubensis]|nr:hypothetical protein F4860DRAFT_499045 [Xylaria cubensis]
MNTCERYYGTSIASVRGDRPFPPRECGGVDFYFETEILVRGRRNNVALIVGIGLCGEFVDMSDGFPGWLAMAPSTGYHGDDGLMHDFELIHPNSTPRPFGAGDTVGCGIDWDQGCVYYTKNGECVGRIKTPMIRRKCYPVVSMRKSPCMVKVVSDICLYKA